MLATLASSTKLWFRCYLVFLLTAPVDELVHSIAHHQQNGSLGCLFLFWSPATIWDQCSCLHATNWGQEGSWLFSVPWSRSDTRWVSKEQERVSKPGSTPSPTLSGPESKGKESLVDNLLLDSWQDLPLPGICSNSFSLLLPLTARTPCLLNLETLLALFRSVVQARRPLMC